MLALQELVCRTDIKTQVYCKIQIHLYGGSRLNQYCVNLFGTGKLGLGILICIRHQSVVQR